MLLNCIWLLVGSFWSRESPQLSRIGHRSSGGWTRKFNLWFNRQVNPVSFNEPQNGINWFTMSWHLNSIRWLFACQTWTSLIRWLQQFKMNLFYVFWHNKLRVDLGGDFLSVCFFGFFWFFLHVYLFIRETRYNPLRRVCQTSSKGTSIKIQ